MGVISEMAGGEILRSIFGGPVSTRAFCAVAIPKEEPEPAQSKQRSKQPSGAAPPGTKPAAPVPKPKPIDPKVLRKKQLQSDLDLFEDLTTDGPAKITKPKPKPRPASELDAVAGPGPGSAKLGSSSGRASASARAAVPTTNGGGGNAKGSVAGVQRSKLPAPGAGTVGAKPGSGPGSATPGGAKAAPPRPGGATKHPPGPATNGTGSRAAPTNHQRQGGASGLVGGKPGGQLSAGGAGQRPTAAGPSTSGRPVPATGAKPGAAGAGLQPRLGAPGAGQGAGAARGMAPGARPGGMAPGARPGGMAPGARPGGMAPGARPGGMAGAGGLVRRDVAGQRRPGGDALGRRRRDEDEYEDDFVVDDDEGEEDWRRELRRCTRYDPSRFRDDNYDDRMMEASWRQVVAEEKRSERLGRMEDELAEEEEEKRRKDKVKKMKQAAKKQRTD